MIALHHRIWSNPTEPRADYVPRIVNREIWHRQRSRGLRHACLTPRIGLPGLRGLGNTYEPSSTPKNITRQPAQRLLE
jgi:hypothetical protein